MEAKRFFKKNKMTSRYHFSPIKWAELLDNVLLAAPSGHRHFLAHGPFLHLQSTSLQSLLLRSPVLWSNSTLMPPYKDHLRMFSVSTSAKSLLPHKGLGPRYLWGPFFSLPHPLLSILEPKSGYRDWKT